MKPSVLNFCETIRNAIVELGCSTELVRNVVNAELGKMVKTKDGEEKTGNITVSMPKKKAWSAKTTVNLGSEKYELKNPNEAVRFAAFNDAISKAEKLCSTMKLSFNGSETEMIAGFGAWLKRVGTPKPVTPAESVKA